MTREEAPDHARPDDANPFHAAPRVSQRGDMSVKQHLSADHDSAGAES
jgi:hypothetical protein